MRWVTAKPPNMLMAVSTSASEARPMISELGRSAALANGDICTSAPMAMMELMALVTLMSGVCSAGFTFHTTM